MVTFVGILLVDVGDILGIMCFLWMILDDFLDECLDDVRRCLEDFG